MPLRTTCGSCGKKLSVRDEHAGKKVKCPGCGTVFVAAADAASTGVKAAPPRSAPPSAKDNVSAKPMAKKPAPPPIDDEEEEMEERPVRSKKPAPREDDEDEDDDRPARKSKSAAGGSKLWLWLALAGVLVLGGAAGVYFIFFTGPTNTGPIAKGKGGGPVIPVNPDKAGEQNPDAGGGLSLADLIPGDALVFATIGGETWNAKLVQNIRPHIDIPAQALFQREFDISIADLERLSVCSVVSFDEAQKNPMVAPFVVIVQSKRPFEQQHVIAALQAGAKHRKLEGTPEFLDERTMVIGTPAMLQAYKNKKGGPKASGVLEQALAKANSSPALVVALTVPPQAGQLAAQALPGVPPTLSKISATFASLELTDRLDLQVSATMESAVAAQDAKKDADAQLANAGKFLDIFAKDPQLGPLVKIGKNVMNDLKIGVQDKVVTVALNTDISQLADLAMPLLQKMQGAASSATGSNNLKQIALAWHNHHDTFNLLPPQTFRVPPLPLGTPPASVKGLSWRVAILPFIEEDKLFKQFKLDEPWDSPHNKQLIPKMPKIYESPTKSAPPGMTYYQTFTGPNTVNKILVQGMRFAQIPDGTSNTIIVAEAAQPVEWTRPVDIEVSPKQPIVLGGDNTGTQAAFADGTVRRLPRNLDQQTLRWLIDPADGNVIPDFDNPPGKK